MAEHDTDTRLLTRAEVEKRCGLGTSTVYRLMAAGHFPAPLRLTPGAVRWRSDEIDEWIASRPRGGSGAGPERHTGA